ncbi:MAG: hypothetical protein HY294_02770 [Candidatus Rokubacteria bacterium]|nr:hypothetical protein [Candidatus Rokubacteria bacterium]
MDPAERARLRASLDAAGLGEDELAAVDVAPAPHGTRVGVVRRADGAARRRFAVDRAGTLAAVLDWGADDTLAEASVRLPGGAWITIEPRATHDAPWGRSDRLWIGPRPRARQAALTVCEAVAYHAVDRLPALAEPARLPRGAGTAVLNLIAELAADQRRERLIYGGPYPTEQLFSTLLDSFRHDDGVPDPLAAFAAGTLGWRPAPFEPLVEGDGLTVQLRDGVEAVAWRGRVYRRDSVQGHGRRGPHRVRDAGGAVRCSLWALGSALEDHLELTADGRLVAVLPVRSDEATPRPLPRAVARGVVAVVAATSAAALGPALRETGAALTLEWAALGGELVTLDGDRGRVAMQLRRALVARIAAAPGHPERLGLAFAALGDVAVALGDTLQLRAQARLAAVTPERQAAALTSPPPADPGDARRIADAVEALLEDVS